MENKTDIDEIRNKIENIEIKLSKQLPKLSDDLKNQIEIYTELTVLNHIPITKEEVEQTEA